MILLLGKNGSGKTYITRELEEKGVKKSVSFTTRPKRPKEEEGKDYFFVDKEEFEKKIGQGEFIEYKTFRGYYYGTPKENVESTDIILSGGIISPQLIPYIETIYFIDSPLSQRYEGMKFRKSTREELFDRIHGENDEYLFDQESKVFLNTHQPDIVDQVYSSLKDKSKVPTIHFKEYLARCVDSYKLENHQHESQFLQFLNYEEYILRKMYLEGKLTREEYEDQIARFLANQKYPYMENGDAYSINLDGEFTYCKKLVKKNETK